MKWISSQKTVECMHCRRNIYEKQKYFDVTKPFTQKYCAGRDSTGQIISMEHEVKYEP